MKLFEVDTVAQALFKIKQHWKPNLATETVCLDHAFSRVLAKDVTATQDIPNFERSTVDGYAVIAKDLYGAGESMPTFLQLVGSVQMGEATDLSIRSGEAVYVPTGGMLPKNANAVVMLEYVEVLNASSTQDTGSSATAACIAVYHSVAEQQGVMSVGEDIGVNDLLFCNGHRLKAHDIGVLAAVGMSNIKVRAMPKVSVFSTGDEIVPPSHPAEFGKIRDINSYVVAAILRDMRAIVASPQIVRDDYPTLLQMVAEAKACSDIVILSGGSSVGAKDYAARIISELGDPGVITHGLAMKPGKPTVIGVCNGTLMICLPGHPAAATMVAHTIVKPALKYLLGAQEDTAIPLMVRLDCNVPSAPGKQTYQMVRIEMLDGQAVATPIYGKSGSIQMLSKANGYIVIDENTEGLRRDSIVECILW